MSKIDIINVLESRAGFLDDLPNPAFIVDGEMIIQFSNKLFLDYYDLKKGEVSGKMTCEEICATQLCGTPDCPIQKSKRTKKIVSKHEKYTGKNGETTYLNLSATPLFDGKEHAGAMIDFVDVSENYAVKNRQVQLEEDMNAIPTPIVEIDTKYTITYINFAGAEVSGLMPEEVIGKKCYDIFKTPHCKTENCACTKAMKNDNVFTAQTIARPQDGVIIPIKYTGAPVKNAQGDIIGAIEFVLDTTEEMKGKQDADEKINNLNSIPTPIMAVDTDLTITYMNPAGAGVGSMTPDEAIGKKCYDIFKTPHCNTEKCAVTRSMKTDSIVTEQTIARPKEGVIIPIRYTGAPIKDAKGNIKGALEYVIDITEEMKGKQDADEKINNLNSIPTPIMAVDTDLTITYMNPAGAGVGAMTPDEAIGKKCYDIFKTPHCNTEKCAVTRSMKTDSIVTEQTIARPKEGVIIPIRYTGAPIKDAKGNIKGALEFVIDITEEAKGKQDADEKINNLNSIPTPIMAIDTELTITYMNPAGAGVGGMTPDEAIGKKCYDIFKTPHCNTEKCAVTRSMKTDSVVTEQTIARPKEGVIIPIRYTGAPIKDAKGNIKGALEYVIDITEEMKGKQDSDEKINNLNSIPIPTIAVETD